MKTFVSRMRASVKVADGDPFNARALRLSTHACACIADLAAAAEEACRRYKVNDPGTATAMAVLKSQIVRLDSLNE